MVKPDHRTLCIYHSISRARERLGLELDETDINKMSRMIRQQKSYCVYHESNRRKCHKLKYMGKTIYAVYDKKLKVIATMFDEETYLEKDRLRKTSKRDFQGVYGGY